MKIRIFVLAMLFILAFSSRGAAQTPEKADALPAPGLHHLHLNSTDPDAAIDFYARQFPSTSKATVAGFPALETGKAYVLFTPGSPRRLQLRRRP